MKINKIFASELEERPLAKYEYNALLAEGSKMLYGYDGKRPLYLLLSSFDVVIHFQKDIWRFRFGNDIITDHGSVPLFLPPAIASGEGFLLKIIAFYLHDMLYATNLWTRKEADQLLREVLKLSGYNLYQRNKYYWAVRLFGASRFPKPKDVRDYCKIFFKAEQIQKHHKKESEVFEWHS